MPKKSNKTKSRWTKVSDLKEGMPIAVPDDNGGILWDEIESIQPVGREQVYDIEVQGTHNFAGNDIFAHNTYINGGDETGAYAPGYLEPGQVVAFDQQQANGVRKVTGRDGNVLGVVESYDAAAQKATVRYSGRMSVLVTAENGDIEKGDLLTASQTLPGYAMKMTSSGNAIGTALESSTAGTDKIMAMVNLGYQRIDVAQSSSSKLIADQDYDFNGHELFNVKAIASLSGKWAIADDGTITAEKIIAETVETKKLKIAGANTSTVGRATIVAGAEELVVENENVTDKSTVLITFRGNINSHYWIAEQKAGWFKLKVAMPPSTDINFDYWIVETDQAQLGNDQLPITNSQPEPPAEEPPAEEPPAEAESSDPATSPDVEVEPSPAPEPAATP